MTPSRIWELKQILRNQKFSFLEDGGYGNLGDDAILLGTCQLIIDNFDKCELTVMSYDKSETMAALSRPEMRVVDSIHRVRFGELAYRELKGSR